MKTNLLSIFILITFFLNAQDCSDLFISEYVEGPANNNGIEIYNPTNNSIDLSSYTINRYSNGSSSSPEACPHFDECNRIQVDFYQIHCTNGLAFLDTLHSIKLDNIHISRNY